MLALTNAAEILTKGGGRQLISEFSPNLLNFSRATLTRISSEQWLDYSKDFSEAHFKLGSYWEKTDPEQARSQFAMGAAWGTRMAMAISSLATNDERKSHASDAIKVAEYLNNKAGPLINKALLVEWSRRRIFVIGASGSKDGLVRTDANVRPAGVFWMRFTQGFEAIDDILARSKKDGDTDDMTKKLFALVVDEEDDLQGR